MAVYKIKEKKQVNSAKSKRIVGIVLIATSCVFLFGLMTSILGFLNKFLIGTFGLFAYPMAILMFLCGVAFLNNKKYVLSKKYTAFLTLSIIFLLCVIQMAIVGNQNGLSFGEHLLLSYEKITVGGIVLGVLTTSLTYLVGYVWAFVIFGVLLAVFGILYADSLMFLIKQNKNKRAVGVSIKNLNNENGERNIMQKAAQEEKIKKEEIERQNLGMARDTSFLVQEKQTVRPSILTPPEIDFDKFFGRSRMPSQEDVQENLNELKIEDLQKQNISPDQISAIARSNSFDNFDNKVEDIVSNVDEILKEVVEGNFDNQQPENNFERDYSFENTNISSNINSDFSREAYSKSFERSESENLSNVDNFGRDGFSRESNNLLNRERGFSRENTNFSNNNGFSNMNNQVEQGFGLNQSNQTFQPQSKQLNENSYLSEIEAFKPFNYIKPPLDLITTKSTDMSELDEGTSRKSLVLENTLQEFGVGAKVQDVVIGPAVTRYELEMPTGVTVKKIVGLSSDIALTLEANGGDVRIEAPVPGRNVVGIEVPNEKIAMVSLKDILLSQKFQSSKSPLSVAIGKDITGNILVGCLDKMPHLLIAGTTGSGKSVMLNSIILSLIYKSSPDDVRLLLVDPKILEFSIYEGIPHLLTPKVLTDVNKASNALTWAVEEMERRYRLLADANARNLQEYNQSNDVLSKKKKKIPYIVIIIDEFSDFMMTCKKDVEDKIVRIGQKARAAGIHMILATQNPTVDSVTGVIKANFPSRIAFKVASRVNSDVIIGNTGAEKLLGRGDMLYAPIEYSSSPKRVQGCFVSTEEVANIVNYLTMNNEPNIDKDVVDAINRLPKTSSALDDKGMDDLLPHALKVFIDNNQASISMLQRKFRIGYSRAASIVDQMTDLGYISEADGAKSRKVFIDLKEFYELFGDLYS